MGNANAIWKVDNENKYFKHLSGDDWGEFVDDKQVFRFTFISKDGPKLTLKKTDGSILNFDSDKVYITFNGSRKLLYHGKWIENSEEKKDVYEDSDSGDSYSPPAACSRRGG